MESSTTKPRSERIKDSIIRHYAKQSLDNKFSDDLSSFDEFSDDEFSDDLSFEEYLANLSSCDAIHPKVPPPPPRVVMNIAPSVVAVSLFNGIQRKIDCSGLIIGWNDETGEATVLTTAKLLRILMPEEARQFFHIFVRLPNGTLLYGIEDYVNYHHNLITVKVKSSEKLPVVDLRFPDKDFGEGMRVYSLGRDFFQCSLLRSEGEFHQKYPFFGCEGLSRSTCQIREECEGGPLITSDGYVFGVNFFNRREIECHYAYPLPIQVFLPCLKNWSSYGTVMWPWFGLTVVDICQLPDAVSERLRRRFGEKRVIVVKVCEDSHARQLGVRPRYSVTSCDGCDISSVEQYSKKLLQIADDMVASIGDSDTRPHQVVIQRYGGDKKDEEITVNAKMVAVNDLRFWYCWPDDMDQCVGEPLRGSQTGTFPGGVVGSLMPEEEY